MSRSEELIDELERLAPDEETPPSNWEEVRRRANASPSQQPYPRHRRSRLFLVAVTLVLAVSPTLAFSEGVRDLLGLGGRAPVFSKAELLISAPVGNGFHAHLWNAPSTTGGRCSFMSIDHRISPPSVRTMNGGGECGDGESSTIGANKSHPLLPGLSITRRLSKGDPRKWVPPIVDGAVLPSLRATRVRVEWRGGSYPLTVDDNYFLGGTPKLYVPPFRQFPFYVVAYNASGREVARKKLESPNLRLMSHGWKQYAREYHRWQRAHRR